MLASCYSYQSGFNPRTYIRYDKKSYYSHWTGWFQSTYLYKVRRLTAISELLLTGFNPRTYIRYDVPELGKDFTTMFQSTYLYKVRRYKLLGIITTDVSIHVPI